MNEKEKVFTEKLKCRHCLNEAPMEVVAEYTRVLDTVEELPGYYVNYNKIYQIVKCPACYDVSLYTQEGADWFEPSDFITNVIFPSESNNEVPSGLPTQIEKAYQAALKVKSIDANAFVVLLGRVLEMVCQDRTAVGDTLSKQLQDLSSRNEIPDKLAILASKLRAFRNIGAHATLGELTNEETPIVEGLIKAILAYVYSAPYLASIAEQRFEKLKQARGEGK